jgi:hypothetical protein
MAERMHNRECTTEFSYINTGNTSFVQHAGWLMLGREEGRRLRASCSFLFLSLFFGSYEGDVGR